MIYNNLHNAMNFPVVSLQANSAMLSFAKKFSEALPD